MTQEQHRARLRRLGQHRRAAAAVQRTLPAVAQDAHASGLAIAEIARLLAVSRMYAHRLVHGRTDRAPS